MRYQVASLFISTFAVAFAAASPAAAVAAAHADCLRLAVDAQLRTRYLSLYNVPEKSRKEFLKVLSFHVNSLSREAHIELPRLVRPDLVAVDLRDYTWDKKVWERLLKDEPYFHITTLKEKVESVYWPAGVSGGKAYAAGYYPTKKKIKTVAQAPWLDAKEITSLTLLTRSEIPIVRADWFIYQTAIQFDRKAGYYDFLGLGKKEQDFDDLLGADQAKSRKVKREIIGLVARSGVTLQNRAIVRLGAASGGYWISIDFKKSTKASNVIRQLDNDLEPPKGDASERYGVLANNLFAFWLQNDKGVRQDFAPDFIASDSKSGGNDRRVHIGLSCIRCHVEGLRPIKDYARRLYRGSIKLASPDHEKLVRLKQLYLSDLDQELDDDRIRYARALLKATSGMRTEELARTYGEVWDAYAEADIDADIAARELATTKEHLLKALKARGSKGLDPVLAGLIADDPLDIRREHWEEIFAEAMTVIREVKP